MAEARSTESNVFLDYPGVVATFVAIVIALTFVGALYVNATGHHEEGEGEHAAPPAGAPAAH